VWWLTIDLLCDPITGIDDRTVIVTDDGIVSAVLNTVEAWLLVKEKRPSDYDWAHWLLLLMTRLPLTFWPLLLLLMEVKEIVVLIIEADVMMR